MLLEITDITNLDYTKKSPLVLDRYEKKKLINTPIDFGCEAAENDVTSFGKKQSFSLFPFKCPGFPTGFSG